MKEECGSCFLNIFFPIEVVKREYHSKLVMSALLASKGFRVYIGHKGPVERIAGKANGGGVYFNKHPTALSKWKNGLESKGVVFVSHDEESGVIYEKFREYYKRRLVLENIPYQKSHYCWGEDDYVFLSERFGEGVVKFTGSHRSCLWGKAGKKFYRSDIDNLKNKHGSFVLFVTNFGVGNSYLGEKGLARLSKRNKLGEDAKILLKEKSHKDKRLMEFFRLCAIEVANNTSLNVIIRPHPVENISYWRGVFKGHGKIFVENDLPLTPWLLASEAIVQNGCTSAVEAVASGKRSIALGELKSDFYGEYGGFANSISEQCFNSRELLDALSEKQALNSGLAQDKVAIVNKKICSPGELSSIFKIVDDIAFISKKNGNGEGGEGLIFDSYLHRYLLRKVVSIVPSFGWGSLRMAKNKRQRISAKQFRSDFERAVDLLGLDSGEFSLREVGDSAFCISPCVQ